jgi:hypothetical protein
MADATWVRWVVVAIAALAVIALLAYRRGDPGVGDRVPDPEDAMALVVVETNHGD